MVSKGTEKDTIKFNCIKFNCIKFNCIKCNYNTYHRGHWKRHLLTRKHQMITNNNEKNKQNEQTEQNEQNEQN